MGKNRQNKEKKNKFPRRALFGKGSRFSEWWNGLWSRVGNIAGVREMVETEEEPSEPIDFSAPSVPYYTELSKKFNLARIVLYMVLFAFLVVTLVSSQQMITYENLYYLVKDINAESVTAQSCADHLNYPVSRATPSFAAFRGGMVVAGGEEITALSGSGKQTLSDNVALSNPCVSAGDRYFVAFSRGEKNFSVYNSFVRTAHRLTEYPVYDACMGADGCLAVLTRSQDYASEVIWYNGKMNKLGVCHLGGYVTAMTISQDSRTLAVLSMETEDGAYKSKITLLRRGSGGAVTHQEVTTDGAPLGAYFVTEERLCVIYDRGFGVYRVDGQEVTQVTFEDREPLLWGCSTGYFAVLGQENDTLTERVLWVYDRNGAEVYTAELGQTEKYSSLVMDGQNVYLLGVGHILGVRNQGKRLETATVERNTLALMVDTKGRLMALTPSYARYVDNGNFS